MTRTLTWANPAKSPAPTRTANATSSRKTSLARRARAEAGSASMATSFWGSSCASAPLGPPASSALASSAAASSAPASSAPASGRTTAGAGRVVNPLPGKDGFQDGILSLIDRGASVLDGELGIGIGFAVAGSSLRCLAVVIGLLSVGVVFTLCN